MPKYWGKQIFAHGRFPEVGQMQKTERKNKKIYFFFVKKFKLTKKICFFCIYLLVMPPKKLKSYFTHGRFPRRPNAGRREKSRENDLFFWGGEIT